MRSDALEAKLTQEFPRLRFVRKDGDAFSKLVDVALRLLTVGGQRGYMTKYVTTIGATIYLPRDWDARDDVDRVIVLRHEAVHLRQFARRGFVLTALAYLTVGRAALEREAYEESLRATAELRGDAALDDPALREYVVRQFTGPAYAWMWPFPKAVRRWYDDAVRRIRAERSGERGPPS